MSAVQKLVFALALLVVTAAGCASPFSVPEKPWMNREFAAPSENILWTVCGMAVAKTGFQVGTGADPSTMTMKSAWRTQLAPFRGDGFRQRVELRIKPAEAGKWRVEVRVERENNMDIKRPMEPGYAKWESAPDDGETGELILERVRAFLSSELPAEKSSKPTRS